MIRTGIAATILVIGAALVWWCVPNVVPLIGFIMESGASWYGKHHAALAPLLTLAAGVAVAAVALVRHFAQTDADRQRRITESFSKAIEQLGSDKLEVRLGGIYSLERISKESPDDYWTVMENLTAFVRERSRRNEAERTSQDFEQRVQRRAYSLWQKAGRPDGRRRAEDFWAIAVNLEELGEPPATDIAAVLTVVKRRSWQSRQREGPNDWHLDLSGAILKRANLMYAHLEHANLMSAHLEHANLTGAGLEEVTLTGAGRKEANLAGARLKGAYLMNAHLEGAVFINADLEGVDFRYTIGLSELQLRYAYGSPATQLPAGLVRPAHWPAPEGA